MVWRKDFRGDIESCLRGESSVVGETAVQDARCVVTIGNFDGVHRGHQVLIDKAVTRSREARTPMRVLTFHPHPAAVLRGSLTHFLLTPGQLKHQYLVQAGAGEITELAFTADFATMPPEVFLDEVLGGSLRAAHVVVGYNFTFGHKGAGTVELLEKWGRHSGVTVDIVEPARDPATDRAISSSWIRTLIAQGQLKQATEFLGHPFTVEGTVQEGDHRGRGLGARTLNLVWPEEQVLLPYGVYAGLVRLQGQREPLKAVANFGVRPTFDGNDPRLEIHLLGDILDNWYGRTIQFDLLHHLREERRFDTAESLADQIQQDVAEALRVLTMGS